MAKQKQPKYWLFLSVTSLKTLLSKARKRSRSEIRFQSEARPQEDERKRSLIGESTQKKCL